jgi:hypothetical protein
VRGGRDGIDHPGQALLSADLVDQLPPDQLFTHGYYIDRLPRGVHIAQHVEDDLVLSLVEVLPPDNRPRLREEAPVIAGEKEGPK